MSDILNKAATLASAAMNDIVDGLGNPILLKREEIRQAETQLEYQEEGLIDVKGAVTSAQRRLTILQHQVTKLGEDCDLIRNDDDPSNDELALTLALEATSKQDKITELEQDIANLELEITDGQEYIDQQKQAIAGLQSELAEMERANAQAATVEGDETSPAPATPGTADLIRAEQAAKIARAKAWLADRKRANGLETPLELP